jgi:hypothetical protein
VTGVLLAAILVAAGEIIFPNIIQIIVTFPLSPEQQMTTVGVALLLWVGMASRHRSMSHTLVYATAIAIGTGIFGYLSLQVGDGQLAIVFGAGLATHIFVGIYSHLTLDETQELIWERDSSHRDDIGWITAGATRDYTVVSVGIVCCGIVLLDSSVALLMLLCVGYPSLVAARTLPWIDMKGSLVRGAFDLVIFLFLLQLLLRQVAAVVPLEFPAILVPIHAQWMLLPFLVLVTVLWFGRNSNRDDGINKHDRPYIAPRFDFSKRDSMTDEPLWRVAVSVGTAWFVYTLVAGLPTTEAAIFAGGIGAYIGTGLFHCPASDTINALTNDAPQ